MLTLIFTALTLGLGGSLHCLGMCGPMLLALPFQAYSKSLRIFVVLLYHIGRIGAYMVLGTWIFLFGKSLDLLGVSRYLSIAIGILVLLNLSIPVLFKNGKSTIIGKFTRYPMRMLEFVFRRNNWYWSPVAGFLNGLLPCGVVYVAMAASLATSSVFPAYGFMLFFGIGTLPMMLAISILGYKLKIKNRLSLKRVTPILSVCVAILLIIRGLNLGIPYLSPKEHVERGQAKMECCRK